MFLCTKLGGTAEVENFCPSIDRTKVFFYAQPRAGELCRQAAHGARGE